MSRQLHVHCRVTTNRPRRRWHQELACPHSPDRVPCRSSLKWIMWHAAAHRDFDHAELLAPWFRAQERDEAPNLVVYCRRYYWLQYTGDPKFTATAYFEGFPRNGSQCDKAINSFPTSWGTPSFRRCHARTRFLQPI